MMECIHTHTEGASMLSGLVCGGNFLHFGGQLVGDSDPSQPVTHESRRGVVTGLRTVTQSEGVM